MEKTAGQMAIEGMDELTEFGEVVAAALEMKFTQHQKFMFQLGALLHARTPGIFGMSDESTDEFFGHIVSAYGRYVDGGKADFLSAVASEVNEKAASESGITGHCVPG
jgi:hypothetical protein